MTSPNFQINNPKTFLELVGPGNEAGLTANPNSLVSIQTTNPSVQVINTYQSSVGVSNTRPA